MQTSILILSLPIVFIFHDMEEIVGMKSFLRENKQFIISKIPRAKKIIENCTTEGFALAVYEELVLFIALSIAALAVESCDIFLNLWLGVYIGVAVHFLVHIGQAVVIRKYIPALITSIICLPVSCYFIALSVEMFSKRLSVVWIVSGGILAAVNVFVAHKLSEWWGKGNMV